MKEVKGRGRQKIGRTIEVGEGGRGREKEIGRKRKEGSGREWKGVEGRRSECWEWELGEEEARGKKRKEGKGGEVSVRSGSLGRRKQGERRGR